MFKTGDLVWSNQLEAPGVILEQSGNGNRPGFWVRFEDGSVSWEVIDDLEPR